MLEIRGVWIANRPHSRVLESPENIAEAIALLHSWGFNYLFPVVWTRGYTLYPSQVMARYQLPAIEPFYAQQQRDPLAEIIAQAERYQMKVIPWLEYGFAASHLTNGGHIIEGYPHWLALDRDGVGVRHGGLTWMNGLHPQVQQFILDLVTEIISNYPVAGIQGCDRLPALPITAGYDSETIQQYQTAVGKQPPKNCHDRHWQQWRADRLTDFLAHMYRQVKATRADAVVSLSPAVYPFSLNNLLQDYPTWIERGLVDLIHPQIYRENYSRYAKELKQQLKTWHPATGVKFAPGIALTANGKDLTVKDLTQCLQCHRDRAIDGQVLFHYEGLRKNEDRIAIALANLFSSLA